MSVLSLTTDPYLVQIKTNDLHFSLDIVPFSVLEFMPFLFLTDDHKYGSCEEKNHVTETETDEYDR